MNRYLPSVVLLVQAAAGSALSAVMIDYVDPNKYYSDGEGVLNIVAGVLLGTAVLSSYFMYLARKAPGENIMVFFMFAILNVVGIIVAIIKLAKKSDIDRKYMRMLAVLLMSLSICTGGLTVYNLYDLYRMKR